MIKMIKWVAPIAAVAFLLSGCGSSTGPGPAPIVVSGNWSFQTTSTANQNSLTEIDGQLTSDSVQVAGTVIVIGPCFLLAPGPASVPLFTLTGKLTGDSVEFSSQPVSGQTLTQTLTMSGSFSADGSTFTGTYSIAGGCDDKDTGTVAGTRIPSLTGTFDGNASLITNPVAPAQAISVSAALVQAATPSSFAVLLSGTITVTGSSCFTHGTATSPTGSSPVVTSGGDVYGQHYIVIFIMDDGSQLQAFGSVDPTGKILTNSFVVLGGNCPHAFAAPAPLTRQ